MKKAGILALWVMGVGYFLWLLIEKDPFGDKAAARAREARVAADKACIAFCRDVEAVSVGEAGVCACPVRGPE